MVQRPTIVVAPLLLVQVIYKFTTPFTVGSYTNPVVLSNLAIATLHLVTLVSIYRQLGRHSPFRA